jgi:Secretion system C-terminal sorting domain/Beta-propeller repeat
MKLKLIVEISLMITILTNVLYAQSPDWKWAKGIGGVSDDIGLCVATDDSGYIYYAGNFSGDVDFNPGVDSFIVTTSGGISTFIEKLSPSGEFIWVKTINGTPGNLIENPSLAVTSDGNLFFTGSLLGTADFDPGPASHFLTANIFGVYFVNLDSYGNFKWASLIDGLSNARPSLTVDLQFNIYSTGSFQGTVDFDPGANVHIMTSDSNYYANIYTIKMDSSGNFIWAFDLNGRGFGDWGSSITTDNFSNIYITGSFVDTVDFDPGAGTYNLIADTSIGNKAFVAKYDSSGNLIWAKSINGNSIISSYDIIVDEMKNVYAAGTYDGDVDFDPDSISVFTLTDYHGGAGFILKLNPLGNFVWVKEFKTSGGSSSEIHSITLDTASNIYSTGNFTNQVDFDPGVTSYNLNCIGGNGNDIFVSKLDKNGNFNWVAQAGGIKWEYGQSIVVNDSGNAIVCGSYISSNVDFGSNTLHNISSPAINNRNVFVAKLANMPVGILDLNSMNQIIVTPNPAKDYLLIRTNGVIMNANLNIYDLSGRMVYSTYLHNLETFKIDTKSLETGYYLLLLISDSWITSRKFIISK